MGMGPAGTGSATPRPPSSLGLVAYASLGLREGPPNPYPCHPSGKFKMLIGKSIYFRRGAVIFVKYT